jgi:hypothetical protein
VVITDLIQIGTIVKWNDDYNVVHIDDATYTNVPYLKRYDEDYQAGDQVIVFRYPDQFLIYSTLKNMQRFAREIKSIGIMPNAPKWAECTCEIMVEHEEQLHTDYVRDENCPRHGDKNVPRI